MRASKEFHAIAAGLVRGRICQKYLMVSSANLRLGSGCEQEGAELLRLSMVVSLPLGVSPTQVLRK
jgi:hypothetical protein